MPFRPVKQFNAILQQEYFEPTISWAFRVVLALNVPLIGLPFITGFRYEVVWAAFGGYMLSLIDYRGLHVRKIIIQSVVSAMVFVSAIIGMNVGFSLTLSVVAMFVTGMFAALIRNWSTYGSSIGVAVGFFFLFGLSNPQPFEDSVRYGLYLLAGAGWAIFITFLSFPLRPSNPVKRSVAKIWKANTDFLDEIVEQLLATDGRDANKLIEKELGMRTSINQSMEFFERREKTQRKAQHYDTMMDLRRTSSLFSAAITSLHEELDLLNAKALTEFKSATAYKTLSALAQASARMAIVIFSFRPEDLTMVKMRTKRYEIALELFMEASQHLTLDERERIALQHFTDTLNKAHQYLQQSIALIEAKLQFSKSDYLENYKLTLNNFLAGLNPNLLLTFVRSMINTNSQQFRYALRVAFALSLAVFVYKYFDINHGHWIALTIIIVIQPYYGATLKKGIERMVGTVSGIVLGGLVLLLPLPHEAFVGLMVVVSFCVAYFLRNNYKVGVFFVTIMMVVLMQLSQQASWTLIGWRVLSTLIGAFLAVIAGYAFWPVWEKQRFPILMKAALQQNKSYLQQVINYYNKKTGPEDTWHKQRRLSEAANSDVFACVQRMYDEPQHIQERVSTSYSLVGANIRISREITSISLSIHESRNNPSCGELNLFCTQVAPVFELIGRHTDEDAEAILIPDFNAMKETLNLPAFEKNKELNFIRSELEKILFELETMCVLLRNDSRLKIEN